MINVAVIEGAYMLVIIEARLTKRSFINTLGMMLAALRDWEPPPVVSRS